jgi:flagellar hook-associated protein 2
MLVSNNIYNHLSAQLVPQKRNTAHKSSELKAVYSNMAKLNKKSPLFLVSLSEQKQEHIIDIKESALTLKDVADSFSDPESTVYSQKTLYSSDEASITGAFRRQPKDELPASLSIEVDSLATEQVNVGEYVRSDDRSLPAGSHRFAIDTSEGLSQFNLSVSFEDTNLSIQNRIADSINSRELGINASVLREGANSALMLQSTETGAPASSTGLHFSLKDENGGQGLTQIYGLSDVAVMPQDSQFKINGEPHSSTSNHISINQIVELDFHRATGKPVEIGFVPDTRYAKEQLESFMDAYNNLVGLAEKEGHVGIGSRSLLRDISGIVEKHRETLEHAGITVDDTGRLSMADSENTNLFKEENLSKLFKADSEFRKDIAQATDRLTLDPMAYINKLIVTYPNKEDKAAGATYTQSLYSGLMYNNYA